MEPSGLRRHRFTLALLPGPGLARPAGWGQQNLSEICQGLGLAPLAGPGLVCWLAGQQVLLGLARPQVARDGRPHRVLQLRVAVLLQQ